MYKHQSKQWAAWEEPKSNAGKVALWMFMLSMFTISSALVISM